MSDNNNFNLDASGFTESIKTLKETFKDLDINTNLINLDKVNTIQPAYTDFFEKSKEIQAQMETFYIEKDKKEAKRDEWLRTIAENVLAIKNNSDKLVLSIDDLIEAVVVSNNISESNMLVIDEQLQRIIRNGKVNVIDEIKKATLALSTQKGLEVGFVFLLKSLRIL